MAIEKKDIDQVGRAFTDADGRPEVNLRSLWSWELERPPC